MTVNNFAYSSNRVKQLFQTTQHTACEMGFTRLDLNPDVEIRRRLKSDIRRVNESRSVCSYPLYCTFINRSAIISCTQTMTMESALRLLDVINASAVANEIQNLRREICCGCKIYEQALA